MSTKDNIIIVDGEEFEPSEYFSTLDTIRESGKINMFGAPQWLVDNMGLSRQQSNLVFIKWTETYDATS